MTPRRSLHFVPGGNERMFAKALGTAADALVLDLEDSVAPERKGPARSAVAEWLAQADFGAKEALVHINPLATAWGIADLQQTAASKPAAYLVPKPESGEALAAIDTLLARLECDHGHGRAGIGLIPIVETPLGVHNAHALAECRRLAGLTWGAEDLAASLGAAENRDAAGDYLPVYQHCRTQTLLCAAGAGVAAIDTVTVEFRDPKRLARDCAQAVRDGFAGKLSIHPDQIDAINAAFTPTAAQVAEAEALLTAFAAAQAEGRMAFVFDGQMVDAPHLSRARALLARAERISGAKQCR